MKRRELGGLEIGFVIAVILLVVPSAILLKSYANWKQRQRGTAAAAPIDLGNSPRVIPEVFRESPPPTINPDCVQKVLKSYYPSLKWNGFSWVDASDPAPPANSAAGPEWRGRISTKVGAVTSLFAKEGCNTPAAPNALKTPQPQNNGQATDWNGTWYLVKREAAISQYNPPDCMMPTTLTVSLQSATEANFTFAGRQTLLAHISGLYSFRVEDGTVFEAAGTLEFQEGQNQLVGDMNINQVAGGRPGSRCQFFFYARKTAPAP